MNKRRVTAALAAVLLSLSFSTVAYAGGGDNEDTTPPPTATVELPVVDEPPAEKPFTPNGTGTVVDNATDEEGKEFFTIMTPSENVFYLVIDRQRTTENVYFLNAVTEADLLALAEQPPEPEPIPTPEQPDPEPTPEEEPPAKKSNTGLLVIVLVLAAVGGGAAYYFKVLRPKQQGQPEKELNEADYTEEDDGPPWDVEDTGEDNR